MLPDFPDFRPLTLDDKEDYNRLVADYQPFADISFTNLQIWWNLDGKLAASRLNGNLVLNYSLPFDLEHSGLGLVGTEKVDESLYKICEYLKQKGRPARVVNVPEFTVHKITDKDAWKIIEEPDFNEYVMSSRELAALEGSAHGRTRRKVERFKRETAGHRLEARTLDMISEPVRENLLKVIKKWHIRYPSQNDPERLEELALEKTLRHALPLGTESFGLFIDGKLHGVALLHRTHDNSHYIINHMKVDYEYPYIFDYLTQQIAAYAVERNVKFLNMEMDLGLEGLRQHKLGLRPVNFYKKFIVEPKT